MKIKQALKKLYRTAKYAVPIMTVVLLMAQIPNAFITLNKQVQEVYVSLA